MSCRWHFLGSGGTYLDVGVIVESSAVRFLSSGQSVPALEGDPALYPQATTFRTSGYSKGFIVTSDDLDNGVVRLALMARGANAGVVYSSEAYPFYWQLKNFGQPVT